MRASVFGASGFFRPKIDRPLMDQSMISRAGRHGRRLGKRASPPSRLRCVGVGQETGRPSLRAIRMKRWRVVASP